jgi:hypothetical protein
MTFPTLSCARAIRDGGIDAAAALSTSLADALANAPADSHDAIKHAIVHAMAAVLDKTVNVAVRLYSELEPDEQTWQPS